MGKPTGFLEYTREASPVCQVKSRVGNFEEFHMPLDEESRKKQAARCMDCGIPFCQSGTSYGGVYSGCPLHNLIPEYNNEIYHGNWKEALERLLKTNNFPEFTGRVCPALCENACVCAIYGDAVTTHDNELAIIEKGYAEGWMAPVIPEVRSGKHVAVVGAGPAGLAAADCLNKRGHSVTVFEREQKPGGLLMYGIPNMKLDKSVIKRRISIMEEEGVVFRCGTDVGRDISAEELRRDFDAVILCCGAKMPRDAEVPGRDAAGICFAVDFLKESTQVLLGEKDSLSLDAAGAQVVIVGGGDTGNDCVATALREGAAGIVQLDRNPKAKSEYVTGSAWPLKPNVYKLDYGQEEAREVFGEDPRMFSSTVKEILKDESGHVREIVTIEIRKYTDKNGRRRIKEIEGTEKTIPCDMLILAAGFAGCEDYTADAFAVKRTAAGNIITLEDTYSVDMTAFSQSAQQSTGQNALASRAGIFATGDCRRGASLVVWAIKEGRECAKEVDRFLMDYSNM